MIVAGNGIVGPAVRQRLSRTATCTMIDIRDGDDIDMVGDATDESTLRAAGIEDAAAFVVTIGDNDQAILCQ